MGCLSSRPGVGCRSLTGVVVLALIAIGLKDLAHLEAMSSWAEFLVGVALLVVGALAVRTAFGLKLHTHEHRHDGAAEHRHLHLHVHGASTVSYTHLTLPTILLV